MNIPRGPFINESMNQFNIGIFYSHNTEKSQRSALTAGKERDIWGGEYTENKLGRVGSSFETVFETC
jgi:hypothetical protein